MSGFVVAGLTALVLGYVVIKYFTRRSLPNIRGPRSPSFLFGNLLELFQNPAGQADFDWQRRYGDVVRFKSVFGEDQLLVADPKALQHIFHFSAYGYHKLPNLRVLSRMINGKGIAWADGEDHKRHKKVLLPGFGSSESRAFLGVFKGCAESMCMQWMEIVRNNTDQQAVLDISAWLSRGMLDAIGQAAFDVQFGATKDDTHPVAEVYKNIGDDVLGHPSASQIFIQSASKYIPTSILEWISDHGLNHRLRRAREMKRVVTESAKELVHEKAESLLAGKENRDVFSLLVKANMDTEAKNKLSEEELLAQMCTILIAGHDTTSGTLSWILLELARHPKMQSRLRTEIREKEVAIQARGDIQFSVADFDSMPYTTAVIKEGLRYHPNAARVQRIASADDILPLSRPIATESGEMIDHIAVQKGTHVVVSIAAYNRKKELWGEDAHEFNPDRWLDGVAHEKKSVPVGVYANLMTFLSGTRACLGWRFAIIEMQAFIVEIIGRFELTMTERSERVCRGPSSLMTPVIEGEFEHGSQLPLAVSVASRVP